MKKRGRKGGRRNMFAQATGDLAPEDVIQNLKDAGCNKKTIEHFIKCMDQDDLSGQLQLMEAHRKCLLDKVHAEEKKIDCLDYLVYQLQRR